MNNWLEKITNSALAILKKISPHRNSPRNHPISKITIHHTAGNITLRALLEWLVRLTTRASYTYGITSAGETGMAVRERDRTWASSNAANDHRAVTIGVANSHGAPDWRVSDLAFAALIELCVDICLRNPAIVQQDGVTRGLWFDGTSNGSLTHHGMFANTTCPGPYLLSRFQEICMLVNTRLAAIIDVDPFTLSCDTQSNDATLELLPINIRFDGVRGVIHGYNSGGRYSVTIKELARTFGDVVVPVRKTLQGAGLTVTWDSEDGIVDISTR
ncbi:MAG: N-acetylmuramoyl-L-alanine amidase [Defluviitaleaceae bacterium]|nr:N-acetylmuramoyl-L-alanine amidase [Defluviitaleaceae bacterium]MCL2273403.1 N-acetylmuramoyl-L-alanine amidase [Defluviitaleaceae bacterium]